MTLLDCRGRAGLDAGTLYLPSYGRVVHLAIASPAVRRFLASEPMFGIRLPCEMYRTEAIA